MCPYLWVISDAQGMVSGGARAFKAQFWEPIVSADHEISALWPSVCSCVQRKIVADDSQCFFYFLLSKIPGRIQTINNR